MNQQRPFISTQLNIFDDNRCIYSSASIGGQPVMISQEQNRKICDTMTTAIASNQRCNNSAYCAGPPPVMCPPNQSQAWPSPMQAQRQGVPGGVCFNFSQPNYCCPPSCIPSAYNPPPPPSPQMVQMPCQTPQSICVDFGRYGMEAMAFQQKCRQQCQGFTYDKQVGPSEPTIFPKCNTCCCGVQSVTLNAEQKEQLFHKIDEGASKSKLKDTACETYVQKRCICFPKPNPNKFGSSKTLVIGERKEKSCRDYDIVEKATLEADAEEYLCCDCLDKWKKQNCRERPSCLKKNSDSRIEKQNEVSISLNKNVLEITEEKQTAADSNKLSIKEIKDEKIQSQLSVEYNVGKISLKDASTEPRRKNKYETVSAEKVVGRVVTARKNLLELQQLFEMNAKELVSCLDQDINLYTEIFENEDKIPDVKMQELTRSSEGIPKLLDTPTITNSEKPVVEISKQKDVSPISTIAKPQHNFENPGNDSLTKKQNEKLQEPSDIKTSLPGESAKETERNDELDKAVQPKIEQKIESCKEETANEELISLYDEESNEGIVSDLESAKPATSTKDSENRTKFEEGPIDQRKNMTNEEGKETKKDIYVVATSEASTSYRNKTQLSTDEKVTVNNLDVINKENVNDQTGHHTLNQETMMTNEKRQPEEEPEFKKNTSEKDESEASTSHDSKKHTSAVKFVPLDDMNMTNNQDQVNQRGNQLVLDTQTPETDIEEGEISTFEEDKTALKAADTQPIKSDKNTAESDRKRPCECKMQNDQNQEERNECSFRSCTCNSSPTCSRFLSILSSVYTSTVEKAGNLLSSIANGRPICAPTGPPFYENPSIITNRQGCPSDCYDRRIIKSCISDTDRPFCCRRLGTNRFCGRTCYDYERNVWYSCCTGCPGEQKEVKITFRETSERRSIRIENKCRNTRYHVVYE